MDSEDGQHCEHGLCLDDLRGQGLGTSAYEDTSSNSTATLCVERYKSSLKPPKVVRARDRKFHKRFKNLPESEKVLKVYHCAYVGDILLQGYLYITTDTFCFYSKILGRERQIEIPISEVVDVTREKTAFIIPNAIGIHTVDNAKVLSHRHSLNAQYVFGSLVSRNRTYRLMSSMWKRVMANEHYGGLTPIRCDSSSVLTYKRDASPSSADKTSSDESYFTDPEFLPQPVLPPASAPPAAAVHPAPSTITGHHRHGSTSTVRASFSSGAVSASGCGPSSAAAAAVVAATMMARRTSSLASVYRSAHDHQYSSAVADKSSTAILCTVGKRRASKLTRIVKLMNSITPTGWWAITCTLMTVFLTLYGFIVFWKVLHLQNDVVYHMYQLSLIENRRLQLNQRRLNASMDEEERGQYLKDIVTEYSLATDRLLVATANLQSVLRTNMELIIQVCKLMTSLHAENNNSSCAGFNKVDCH